MRRWIVEAGINARGERISCVRVAGVPAAGVKLENGYRFITSHGAHCWRLLAPVTSVRIPSRVADQLDYRRVGAKLGLWARANGYDALDVEDRNPTDHELRVARIRKLSWDYRNEQRKREVTP